MPDDQNIMKENFENENQDFENVSDNILPPETVNLQSETQINKSEIPKSEIPMEVHHHPKVEKKNFKEYLLEGLMIFLAVTMGFIAENIREHFTDVRTEKEYLSSFKQQLLINKEQFTDLQNSFIDYKPALDSLANLFFSKNENKDLITTARLVAKSKILNLTTIDVNAYLQLVNSAGLKYIHNVALKDAMARYADKIKAFENYNNFVLNYITQNILIINSLEDWHDFFLDHSVKITPYPELTERERRAMVAFNKIRYRNAQSNELDIKEMLTLNERLSAMVNEELAI
jgi:hypothetical protein